MKSLRIEIIEHVPTGTTKHVKLVVVAHAPALFVIPCGDNDCHDGDHDLTREVMMCLRGRQSQMTGTSSCSGTVRGGYCNRHITYHVSAEYAAK